MNPFYTGIGIARSLAEAPVKVYALAWSHDAPGLHSRFFEKVYDVPDGRDEPEALCRRLLELRRLHDETPVLFPTRDFDVLFLHSHRDCLGTSYHILQPAGPAVPRLLDKLELAQLASDCGIAAPPTVACRSDRDCEEACTTLNFPVVLKPRRAYEWRQKGIWEHLRGRKAIVAPTPAALQEEYRSLSSLTEEVLAQEYVQGEDSDIVVCGCYVDQRGELQAHFTARKSLQDPPLFGTGCLVETADIPDIVGPSVTLLNAAGYAGLAEIEFKHDRASNRFLLIEINPRHWDQHELGTRVGVNVTWAAYQGALGRPFRAQAPKYEPNRPGRWIAERELFLLLVRRARRPTRTRIAAAAQTGLSLFRAAAEMRRRLRTSHNVYSVFHPRDLLPATLMALRMVRELASAGAAAVFGARPMPSSREGIRGRATGPQSPAPVSHRLPPTG